MIIPQNKIDAIDNMSREVVTLSGISSDSRFGNRFAHL